MKSKSSETATLTKDEIKDAVLNKIESGLPELKARLGDKKFHKRAKKATKLLTQGWSKKSVAEVKKSAEKIEERLVSK